MHVRNNARLVLATAAAVALTGGLLSISAGAATAATPAKYADDFNGDGYRDYAVGDMGAVTVTYGTATGPGTKTRTFTQNTAGIPGTSGDTGGYVDAFGDSLANADFNRDGYADLAIADMTEKVGKKAGAGAVTILWGSKTGLTATKARRIPVKHHADYRFGTAIAAGDFNGDSKPDLAIADGIETVYIYRGGFSKSGTTGKVTKHAPSPSVTQVFQPTGLVAGKVTKDKPTDLYVLGQGYVYEKDDMTQAAWFLRGGKTIKSGKYTTYDKTSPNWSPTGVIADFNKDGYGDLAVSDTPFKKRAGSVVVLRGGKTGPTKTSYRLTQNTTGVATASTTGDTFGFALSAGDTNRDGYPDLAVSAPWEKVGSVNDAGGVHILRGGKKGLTGKGSQWFTRSTAGVPGKTSDYALFGEFTRLRDFDRDGDADLLVSDGYYDTSVLLPGGKTGITTTSVSEVTLLANFPQ